MGNSRSKLDHKVEVHNGAVTSTVPKTKIINPKRSSKRQQKDNSTPTKLPEKNQDKVDISRAQAAFGTPEKAIRKDFNNSINPMDKNGNVTTPLTAVMSPEQTYNLNSASTTPTVVNNSFESFGNSFDSLNSSPRKNLTESYGGVNLAPLHGMNCGQTNTDEICEMPDDPLFDDDDRLMVPKDRMDISDNDDAQSTQSSLSSVLGESSRRSKRKTPRKKTAPLSSQFDSPSRTESGTSKMSDSSDSLPNIYHGNGVCGLVSSPIDGNNSVASASFNSINTSDFESIGQMSHEISLSDVSRTSTIGSMKLKRKSRMPPYTRGINKRTVKSKRNQGFRPTAENAFETLPQHLIKNALIRQATSTLKDQRFVNRRILKLGPLTAAKIHVTDFECLNKREQRDCERREKRKLKEYDMPTSATFCDGEDAISVTLDSFDLFKECILKLCGIQIQWVEVDLSELERSEKTSIVGDENNGHKEEIEDVNSRSANEQHLQPVRLQIMEEKSQLSHTDSGRSLYSLGKYLHGKEWNEDAMFFYRISLFLLLSALNVREARLLDDRDDCAGFFYVKIASIGAKRNTPSHSHIANVLIKMGDIHGKFGEINDALQAYRGANTFWSKYLASLRHLSARETGSISDMDNFKEHTDAVEGIALTHNRIGGVYCSKGELDSALNSFHQALELQVEALGDNHIEVAKTLHNIGVSHRHKENLDDALKYYIQAYNIFKAELGQENLDAVRTLHNIGGVHRRRKEYKEAMQCFKQVLNVRRTLLGDGHPSVSITLVSMAAVLRRSGQTEEANKFYSAAIR